MSNTTPYRIRAAGHLLNTTSTVAPSLTDPTANTAFKNQMVTVGDDIYFVDATGNAVLMDKPLATSSIEPVVYQGTGFTAAQANDEVNVAEALLLSDGTHIATGRIKYESHPYEIGNYYYLSQTAVGEVTKVQPTAGLVQPLFLVEDADHLLVKVDRAAESVTSAYANIVYVNAADPNTATIFDDVNPPVANDNTLKANSSNLYFGSDNSTWIWNGTAYATKPIVPTTEWYVAGTTTDAGANKSGPVARQGWVGVGINSTPLSTLDSFGSFGARVRIASASTTFGESDFTIVATVAGITVTLPTPVGKDRRIYVIKNWAAGSINVFGLLDGTGARNITIGTKHSLMFQSDNTTWNIIASHQGEHAVPQQGATGAILEGTSVYYNSNGNYTSPLTLPANAPYVGFELMITSDASFSTTINNTNTDMAANFTLTTSKAKVFKWGGQNIKWVALN